MLGGMGIVFVSSGLLHVVGGMHSGYTRKICHLALFASSPLMIFLWPYKSETPSEARWTTLWTVWTSYVMFYLFIKPVRRRFTPALLCFRAIDREEDRPHTLEWLVSQGVAGMVALVAVMIFLARSAQGDTAHARGTRLILVMIPILINGVGDGLAEPVGIRFGRHKYKTRALWYQGKCCSGSFTRSLEVRPALRFAMPRTRAASDAASARRARRACSSAACWWWACSASSTATCSLRSRWAPSLRR
jgi:dolichol kinase